MPLAAILLSATGAGAQAPVQESGVLVRSPLSPAFLLFLQERESGSAALYTADGHRLGDIPRPPDLSRDAGACGRPAVLPESYPSSYDLRSLGKMTPVRDQGDCGSCWTFGAYGSLESALLPEACDFSENHMKNTHGFDMGHCDGGNLDMATAYLARWSGPVNESDDPYNPYSSYSPAGLAARRHVQDVFFLPDRTGPTDNDLIKHALMSGAAIRMSMSWQDSAYSAANRAFYYNGSSSTNHAVTIAGWDDAFDRSKFVTPPPGNGAFIVKNSWGTAWGDGGYFYLSYYDSQAPTNMAVFTAEQVSGGAIYQYDPLGFTNSVGAGETRLWGANVFTATSSQTIAAVGAYALVPGTTVQVSLYRGVSGGPTSGSLASSTTASMPYMGYHTIQLPAPVSVSEGQAFSVVLLVTTPGYTYPLAMEDPIPGYSSAATAGPGQSYVSTDGSSWSDLHLLGGFYGCNLCIKAYAGSSGSGPSVTSVSPSVGPTTGGTTVVVTGTGFQSGAEVDFGGAAATAVTFNGGTSLSAVTPAHPPGAVDVTVTNPGGLSDALYEGFTYAEIPVVTGVSKVTNPLRLKVSGAYFHDPCTVKVNGTPVPTTTYKSSALVVAKGSTLKTLVPKGVTVQITVTNLDDGYASAPFAFTR